jgi:hypothetical protein
MNRHGFIKVSRKMFRHEWWLETREFSYFEAWLDILQMAEWRTRSMVATQFGEIALARGEILASRRSLAARWHWGEKRTRVFLDGAQQRAQRETQAGTVYLVVKYDEYQGEGPAEGPLEGPAKGPAKGPRKEEEHNKNNNIGAFADAWAMYPRRSGGNPKRRAADAWSARIREGVAPDAMLDGLRRYVAYCEAERKIGTPYVQQASTFFGPSRPFEEEWLTQRESSGPLLSAAGNPILSIAEFREQQRRDLEEINKLRVARGEAPIAVA